MPGFLRNMMHSKAWVGLVIREGFLGAVQLRNTSRGPAVEKAVAREFREPENPQQVLGALFLEHDLRTDAIVTSLPTPLAVFREIPLQMQNRKMLDQIMAYQLEPHIPQPVEDMVVGYVEPVPEEPVLAFGLHKEHLAGHLETLSGAGLHPEGVTLDDLAFSSLWRGRRTEATHEPVGILHFHEHARVFQVIDRGRLDFIRILPRGANHAEGLEDTLRLYDLRWPGRMLSEILVTGRGLIGEAPEAALTKATGIRSSMWRPFDGVRHSLGRIGDDLQVQLSLPLALALCAARGRWTGINLLKGEFRSKAPSGVRRDLSVCVAAGLLLVAFISGDLFVRLHKQEAHYAAMKREMTQTLLRAFPDVTQVVKGQELAQMKQKLADEIAQHPWLHSVSSRGSLLDLLLLLTGKLSAHPGAALESLSVEGKKVILEGSVASFQTLDALKTQLAQTGVFETVKLGTARLDKEPKVVKYHFILEMK